jgi:AcrR family transcriptional regulator
MTTVSYRESLRGMLRDRLLDAAQSLTVELGWPAVTMAKIADIAGVSRQTVYNEFGTKPELAQELVARELLRFLEVVRTRLLEHDDVVVGLTAACEGALDLARDNPLLKAALDQVQHGSNDLLPLITTQAGGLIDTAVTTVEVIISHHYTNIGLTPEQLHVAADLMVRLVLSNIMRPSGSPHETAANIGWVAGRVLRRD